MNIKPSDLVLEVGSGNNPNPRSDILVDRYLYDNGQRAGGFRIVVDRPLIVADGYRLPFKDKTFDYVICSHILEHMEDPKKFIVEIMRVGKAGYIEVPSDVSERIFGWNFHLWYCSLDRGTLIFRKKKEGERFGGFFHRLIAQQIWFRRFFEEHEDKFYIKYEWDNQVRLSVDHLVPKKTYLKKLDDDAWKLLQQVNLNVIPDCAFYVMWMKRRITKKVQKEERRLVWNIQTNMQQDEIIDSLVYRLACIQCSADSLIRKTHMAILCRTCGITYPLEGVVPVMLTPKERQRGW